MAELEPLILNYFDVAHAHGVKILHHMAGQGIDRSGYTNVTLSMIQRNVALVKDHQRADPAFKEARSRFWGL